MSNVILSVRGLTKNYAALRAVDSVDLDIVEGETLGLVGESGCGKSTLGRLVLRLIEPTSGEIRFEGTELTGLTTKEMRGFRKDIQIIFQDPHASLNPRMSVGELIGRSLKIHKIGTRATRRELVEQLLRQVGLLPEHAMRYPHEFSGGQRQRISIARALATGPRLVVADEPTSALDVSVQAQILSLLKELRDRLRLTMLFVSHDMGVVRHISDRVAVMYLGRIVEIAPKEEFFERALHPYAIALQESVPVPDPLRRRELTPLFGEVPSPVNTPKGCHFHPRCPQRMAQCSEKEPELRSVNGRKVACFLY